MNVIPRYLRFISIPLAVMASGGAAAEIVTRTLEYRQGDAVLEGYLAYDGAGSAQKPGVLVVHEWNGINPYTRRRVEELARMGYVAFAADIYGKGIRPANPADAAATAAIYKNDRGLLRARVNAGLAELARQPGVDAHRLAAIGYCFGGTAVLELARSGANVRGVVSFHGGLDTPAPADARNIRAKVLALHGADDPFVPPEQVRAFEDEMRAGGVDWMLVKYGSAVHSFTNPDAGNDPARGLAYDVRADRRSWQAMQAFFREIFEP
jgi:dienelactone hydrolase